MPKIRILDEKTIRKIAAGEVIERPASVVKELIENSTDAGATRIYIETRDAGKSLITVTDNGSGMTREDALLSVQRHATSKISAIDDLQRIRTLGFRGEALASICAVADVEIFTKTSGAIAGTQLTVKKGDIAEIKDAGTPTGTTVKVHGLFSGTPARLKHLKNDRVELAHIIDIVSRTALAHDDISFILINDGFEHLHTSGSGKMENAILSVYGERTAKSLVPVRYHKDNISVQGYICTPDLNRASSSEQCIFINNRPVSSRLISEAVRSAYGTMIPKGRHPLIFLKIDIDPQRIDVNVHPAKSEVRFADERDIQNAVTTACANALSLRKRDLYPKVELPRAFSRVTESGGHMGGAVNVTDEKAVIRISRVQIGDVEDGYNRGENTPMEKTAVQARFSENEKSRRFPKKGGSPIIIGGHTDSQIGRGRHPRVLGLALETYAVLENDSGILIMDQHAAHERILFENFLETYRKDSSDRQDLIAPITLELTQKEFSILLQYSEAMTKIGFTVEPFGKNTITIRAVPAILNRYGYDERTFVHDVVDDLILESRGKPEKVPVDRILAIVASRAATAACRKAVKSGDFVSIDYLQGLVDDLMAASNPYSCPHGRPTMITITKKELERKFGRT